MVVTNKTRADVLTDVGKCLSGICLNMPKYRSNHEISVILIISVNEIREASTKEKVEEISIKCSIPKVNNT
jgi:hypothetical protein